MKIDGEKLKEILKDLANDVGGMCAQSSVFIGEIEGRPIRVSAMSKEEAEEEHDFEGTDATYQCLNP